jgi:hypothetical protein
MFQKKHTFGKAVITAGGLAFAAGLPASEYIAKAFQESPIAFHEQSPHAPEKDETQNVIWTSIQQPAIQSTVTVVTTLSDLPLVGVKPSLWLNPAVIFTSSDSRQRFRV